MEVYSANFEKIPSGRIRGNRNCARNARSVLTFLSVLALGMASGDRAFAIPAAPSLQTPANGAGVTEPFTISWSAVSDPAGIVAYNWQVSPSSSFTPVILQNSTSGQTQDTVSGLANGTYFLRVQAVNGSFVQGAWSSARSFSVTGTGSGAPGAPTLDPTKAYSTFHPFETITFTWSAVTGAATYVLQFSKDPTFPVITRGQFDNIPNPTMTFAIGDSDQGNYSARVFAVNSNGIYSAPSNVVTFSVLFNNPIGPPPSPLSPTNGTTLTLPITITWSDVPNPQPSGYELQIARDSGFSNIEEDAPQLTTPARTELSLTPGTKFWRVRSAQGDASADTAAETAWSAVGTFTVNAAPPTPVSVSFTSNPLYSGDSTWVAVQLTAAAPANGAIINLTSSNPAVAPVPPTVNMPPNTGWLQFTMQAGQVTASTPVTITATVNSGSSSGQLTVLPPSLKTLTITPSTISGGAQPGAIVMLNGQAPAGGAVVNLSSDSSAASPPAAVTVQPGNASVSFGLPTSPVTANTTARITATWQGVSVQTPVTLLPQQGPASITLSPTSTVGQSGGSFATVAVTTAGTSDETLQVTSSNPSVASVPNSVIIPAGNTRGGFEIFTSAVTAQTVVTISVSGGGVTQTATLTVLPAPQNATLTVTASGRSGERVISSPAGISVPTGSTQSAGFNPGTSVTLSVSSGRDAIWSGACSSNGSKAKTCRFTLSANSSVTANVQ
jgi:hypothetical protein